MLTVYAYVSPRLALREGRTLHGVIPVSLTAEHLAAMTPDEREALVPHLESAKPLHLESPEATPATVVAQVRAGIQAAARKQQEKAQQQSRDLDEIEALLDAPVDPSRRPSLVTLSHLAQHGATPTLRERAVSLEERAEARYNEIADIERVAREAKAAERERAQMAHLARLETLPDSAWLAADEDAAWAEDPEDAPEEVRLGIVLGEVGARRAALLLRVDDLREDAARAWAREHDAADLGIAASEGYRVSSRLTLRLAERLAGEMGLDTWGEPAPVRSVTLEGREAPTAAAVLVERSARRRLESALRLVPPFARVRVGRVSAAKVDHERRTVVPVEVLTPWADRVILLDCEG